MGFRESFGSVTCWFYDERSLSISAEGNEPSTKKREREMEGKGMKSGAQRRGWLCEEGIDLHCGRREE